MGGISNSTRLCMYGQVVRLDPVFPNIQLVGETVSLKHIVPIYALVVLEVNPG